MNLVLVYIWVGVIILILDWELLKRTWERVESGQYPKVETIIALLVLVAIWPYRVWRKIVNLL